MDLHDSIHPIYGIGVECPGGDQNPSFLILIKDHFAFDPNKRIEVTNKEVSAAVARHVANPFPEVDDFDQHYRDTYPCIREGTDAIVRHYIDTFTDNGVITDRTPLPTITSLFHSYTAYDITTLEDNRDMKPRTTQITPAGSHIVNSVFQGVLSRLKDKYLQEKSKSR